jgi:N-acetylglucosamine-6-sulfatase
LFIAAAFPMQIAAQNAAPRNVVLIISDDHRYDFFSAHPNAPSFLKTPGLDRMASEGVHLANAFVTTSLCSPSRASILTGQYAHNHGVVDNSAAIPEGTEFFPRDLQAKGYNTAYIGKWHMGHDEDAPRPGFDRWVSFRGQGVYNNPLLNVDGDRIRREGYISDILTEYALGFLGEQKSQEPFMMVLSHKAVHAEFMPAERHEGMHADVKIPYAATMALTEANYAGKPHWVRAQRGSWHGVDYAYHGDMNFDEFYRRYTETLLAMDESVGRVLDYLTESGLAENTLVLYLGDNGFLLGEHGLIDKRNAYEESIRVPMIAWAPGFISPGSRADNLVRNIDIAPTFLDLTGASSDIVMDGSSFLDILRNAKPVESGESAMVGRMQTGADGSEAREFLYEYYWEHAFPHTPTTFALRNDKYKYIYYHGVWDTAELYDLENDPRETQNLVNVPALKQIADGMRDRLFDRLTEENAMRVPMRRGAWSASGRLLYD